MALKLDTDLERDQETVPTLNTLAPTSHPPVIVPADAFPVFADRPPVLGFAPAPVVLAEPAARTDTADILLDTPQPVLADPPAPCRPRGRLHLSRYEAAVIALILGCAALCVYRLFWAAQI